MKQPSNQVKTMSRRVILMASEKGGVGKSAASRLLAETLKAERSDVMLVDGDGGVGQLVQFLGARDADTGRLRDPQPSEGVHVFGFHGGEASRDRLLDFLSETTAGVVLVDLPATSLSGLAAMEATLDLSGMLAGLGFSLTVATVVTPYRASVANVTTALASFPNADHVVFRNRGLGQDDDDWELWDGSNARKAAEKAGSSIVDVPFLKTSVLVRLDASNCRFADGDSIALPVADKRRLRTFIATGGAALRAAGDRLGFASVPASAVA
ncbi:MAG: hypothetical protein M3N13_10290 [Candidatus Eremiobacteraeota bacterium]|nr:hypothetical protein [Candidatus Eremiobacteraeota bacterium]